MSTSFMPDIKVEIAFDSGFATPAASRTWTDVSAYVEAQEGLGTSRGRSDEFSDVQPSQITVTLDNTDGRFTPGLTSGANYPNVKIGRPIRVSAIWAAVTYRLFTGYVDEWTPGWPGTTTATATTVVTASSRLAMLARKLLRSLMEEEILYDAPAAYFPFGDPAGSTTASNLSAATHLPLQTRGVGSAITFGAASGITGDALTAATFTGGQWLAGNMDDVVTPSGNGTRVMETWFSVSSFANDLLSVGNDTNNDYTAVQIDLSGHIFAFYTSASGAVWGLTSTNTYSDGSPHHVVIKETLAAGTVSASMYIDGVLDVSSSGAGSFIDRTRIMAGRIPTSVGTTTATISHLAVYGADLGSGRITQHYTSGATGFSGESSNARITRLAGYAGIVTGEISVETGSTTAMPYVEPSGANAQQLLLDVVHTEGGLLFDAGDGTLTFQARGHRYDAASVATFTAATQEIAADLRPTLDDFGMVNDATYTGAGATVRAVDAGSVADRGTYSTSGDLQTSNPLEVADAANWQVYSRAQPKVRYASASIELEVLSSAQITALLAVELGSLITLAGLPTNAPAASVDVFVEGITHTIDGETWLVQLNLSPSAFYTGSGGGVWKLGDATYGQLGQTTILGY